MPNKGKQKQCALRTHILSKPRLAWTPATEDCPRSWIESSSRRHRRDHHHHHPAATCRGTTVCLLFSVASFVIPPLLVFPFCSPGLPSAIRSPYEYRIRLDTVGISFRSLCVADSRPTPGGNHGMPCEPCLLRVGVNVISPNCQSSYSVMQ